MIFFSPCAINYLFIVNYKPWAQGPVREDAVDPIFVFAENGFWESVWAELLTEPEVLGHETVNRTNPQNGRTLLHYAILKEDEEAIEELVVIWRANVNILDYNCKSPLHLAKDRNLYAHIIELLQEASNRELSSRY